MAAEEEQQGRQEGALSFDFFTRPGDQGQGICGQGTQRGQRKGVFPTLCFILFIFYSTIFVYFIQFSTYFVRVVVLIQ